MIPRLQPRPGNARGFTLVELVITMTLASILVGMGVPALRSLMERNWRASLTNHLVSDLMLARSEAVKRGGYVTLCHSSDESACNGTWADGWILFVDSDGDQTLDSGEELLRRYQPDTGPYTIVSATDAITFHPTGMLQAPSGRVELAVTHEDSTEACLELAPTGRPRLNHGGGCS